MDTVKGAYTAQELAPMLGVTERAVLIRAARESWASRPRPGRGGGKVWIVSSMPDATRVALAAAALPPAPASCVLQGALPGFENDAIPNLPPTAATRAGARAAALQLFATWKGGRPGADRTLAHQFAACWNTGDIPAPAWAREALPSFSGNSLVNWLEKVRDGGTASLAGNHGKRAGSGIFDAIPEVYDLVQGILHETPHIKASRLLEMLQTRLGGTAHATRIPSLRRTQAWLKEWKDSNKAYYQYILNPDAYRSRYMLAMGSMSDFIMRMNQRWEMDSTKVDLITSDNTRHNLTAVIDVFTRDAFIYVSRTR